jgi:hypothetical protein
MDTAAMKQALARIQTEYVEMPELKLTLPQARRLFDLSADACNDALTILLALGFLSQTRDGSFVRCGAMPLDVDAIDLMSWRSDGPKRLAKA